MKPMFKLLAILLLGLTLAACSSEPTFDASSEEAMETSMNEMTQDMTEEQKMEFGQAFMSIMMQIAFSSMGDEDKAEAQLKEKLDGKTAQEIIDMANNPE